MEVKKLPAAVTNSQVFDVCCSSEGFSRDGLDEVLTQVPANETKVAHKKNRTSFIRA